MILFVFQVSKISNIIFVLIFIKNFFYYTISSLDLQWVKRFYLDFEL